MELSEEEEVNSKVEAEAEVERKVKEEAVAAKAAVAVEKVTEFALSAASVVILPPNVGLTMGTVRDVLNPPAATMQAAVKVAKAVEKVMAKAKVFALLASFSQYNPFVEVIRPRKRGIHIFQLEKRKGSL